MRIIIQRRERKQTVKKNNIKSIIIKTTISSIKFKKENKEELI